MVPADNFRYCNVGQQLKKIKISLKVLNFRYSNESLFKMTGKVRICEKILTFHLKQQSKKAPCISKMEGSTDETFN